MKYFSERHSRDLESGALSISVPVATRSRIADCMQKYNEWQGWDMKYSLFHSTLEKKLNELYGKNDAERFIIEESGEKVLDAIELYNSLISKPKERYRFQKECNGIFSEGGSSLRIIEGYAVKTKKGPVGERAYGIKGSLRSNILEKALRFFSL